MTMLSSPNGPQRARLVIDRGALARNYAMLARLSGAAEAGGAIKADAYGLGAEALAPALSAAGCRRFFVATPDEGVSLRASLGAGPEIFVLGGLIDAPAMSAAKLTAVLNTPEEVEAARGWGGPCALHVDTGMNRLGLSVEAFEALHARSGFDGLDLRLVMSHLACADERDHPMNARQLSAFRAIRARLPDTPASLANTGGVLMGEAYAFQLTRPGIGLYGGAPGAGETPFEPVARVQAPIVQLRRVKPGETIGYGASFTAQAPMLTATIALGYADGLLRSASNQGAARVQGWRAPILGRVSMDLTVLDVTALDGRVRVGDSAELLGGDLDGFAQEAGTIGYEVLTRLGARLERVYTD